MLQKRWANYIAERLIETHTDYSQRHNSLESSQMTQKKRFHLRNRAVLDAASGATAGCVARFVVGPLDVVKIRFQVRSADTMRFPSPPPFPHRPHCFKVFRLFSLCLCLFTAICLLPHSLPHTLPSVTHLDDFVRQGHWQSHIAAKHVSCIFAFAQKYSSPPLVVGRCS